MNGFLNYMLHFIFIATFSFLYVVSIIILKPFRLHRKRPGSTISLKLSYLLYLLVFLLMAYLVLFYSKLEGNLDDISFDSRYNLYYIAVIISFVVPNVSIMFRRKIKAFRTIYNYVFTAINIIITFILFFIINSTPWHFR